MARHRILRPLIKWALPLLLFAAACISNARTQELILEDLLQGTSTGARSGGSFVAGGWQVTNQYDAIYWHIPTVTHGAAEWDIRGLLPNESRPAMDDKTELFHMYDYTYASADTNYTGYRDNPYKHFVRKIGSLGGATDALELLWQISPNHSEPDTGVLSWEPNKTYHFREEWGPAGGGNSVLRSYRDGVLLRTTSVPGSWNPVGHSVRIGAANPPGTRSAPVGAVYSNLRIWDLAVIEPPPPPSPQHTQIQVFPFTAGNEGWTLETWKSGAYNPGTAIWDSAGGNPAGAIKSTGSGASNNMDFQTREGSILTRSISLEGYGRAFLEYDVKVLQDAPPGTSGTGSGNLLEGSPEDKLVVYYSLNGTSGPWTTAAILSENLNQLPSSWAHRTIDLSNVQGTTNNPNFALRFAWQFNTSIDTGWLDNVRLSGIVLTPGDYNHNGVVDAADYVVWRTNDGTQNGYATWRENFGETIGSGSDSGANSAVPEPTAVAIALVGTLAMSLVSGRKCHKLNA
jgi:hypothetical protein